MRDPVVQQGIGEAAGIPNCGPWTRWSGIYLPPSSKLPENEGFISSTGSYIVLYQPYNSSLIMKAIIAVPVTLAMVYRAWSHKSLTPAGIIAAIFTAVAHAVHPWSFPFTLLIVFFFAGTRVTKVCVLIR